MTASRGLDLRAWQIRAITGAKLASLTGDPRHEHWFATLEKETTGQTGTAGRWAILVMHHASRGDLDRARALYERLPPWRTWLPPSLVAHAVLNLRARAAVLLGDTDGAALAYERLRPWARYFVTGGTAAQKTARKHSSSPPTPPAARAGSACRPCGPARSAWPNSCTAMSAPAVKTA